MRTFPKRSFFGICLMALSPDCTDDESKASDFYAPPDPLPAEVPGTLIRAEAIEPLAEGSKAWRVLYVSTAVDGTAIAVSGLVVAPSRGYRSGFHDFYDIAPELVATGYGG